MAEKHKIVLLIERDAVGVKPGRIFCNIQDGTLSVSFYVGKAQKANLREITVLGYIPGASLKDVISFLDGRPYRGDWYDVDLNKIKDLETKYTKAALFKDVLAHYGSAITSDPLVLARITVLEDKMSKLTKGLSALVTPEPPIAAPSVPKVPAIPKEKEDESEDEVMEMPKAPVKKPITPCKKCYWADYHPLCSGKCTHGHHIDDEEVVDGIPEDVYSCTDCYRKIYKHVTGASKSCSCRTLSLDADTWDCRCDVRCAIDRNCPCVCHTRSRVKCGYCEKKPGCHNPGVEFSSCGHSCHLVCVGKCCDNAGDRDIATTCNCYCHDPKSVPAKSKKMTPAVADSDDE